MNERTRYLRETLSPCDKICLDDQPKKSVGRKRNITLNMDYNKYKNEKINPVNVKSSSQYYSHDKSQIVLCDKDGKICKPWHNQSDRHVIKSGVDIKHNSYDRRLRRLKGSTI